MTGNAGKSMFVDLLELNPKMKCVVLTLDYYRSFKYTSAKQIADYIDLNGYPEAILLDAPRDEETKFLHECYGVLEEISNGRLKGSFQGKILNKRMPRNIPIYIFSNSPPVKGALSEDRWSIKALYRTKALTPKQNDIFIQNARISSNVHRATNSLVTWQNFIETIPMVDVKDTASDKFLFEMYQQNFEAMDKLRKIENQITASSIIPGEVKSWGLKRTSPITKAPENIQEQALKKISELKKFQE